jgi:hypothetical protein
MKMTFSSLEDKINAILKARHQELFADNSTAKKHFESIFTSVKDSNVEGKGEKPTWTPNESYISSLEWLGQSVETYLSTINLRLATPWQENFADSREYEDYEYVHRRVFFGQIADKDKGHPVTAFMLTSAHDHSKFDKPMQPVVQIAPEIS